MKNIKTKIIINGSQESVWNTLMSFKSYSKWNPFINDIQGNAKVGDTLQVSMTLNDQQTVFSPKVIEVNEQNSFKWLGHLYFRGIFDGLHYFTLRSIDTTTTELVHGEQFSGVLAPLILRLYRSEITNNFTAMNKALKHTIENLTSNPIQL